MNPATTPIPTFPLARAWACLSLAAGVGAAAVALGALVFGVPAGLAMPLSALAVCLVAALIALEPIRLAARHGFQRVTVAALCTFPLRVGIAAVGVVAIVKLTSWPVVPLAMWTLLWYLLFLCVEVAVLVRYLSAATAAAAPAMPGSIGKPPLTTTHAP